MEMRIVRDEEVWTDLLWWRPRTFFIQACAGASIGYLSFVKPCSCRQQIFPQPLFFVTRGDSAGASIGGVQRPSRVMNYLLIAD